MNLKLIAKPIQAYELHNGHESLGIFHEVSSWEGLKKLKCGDEFVIVATDAGVSSMFSEVFLQQTVLRVVSATPNLAAKITERPASSKVVATAKA